MRNGRRAVTIIVALLLVVTASSIELFREGGLAAVLRNDPAVASLPPDRPTPGRGERVRAFRTSVDRPVKPSAQHHFTLRFPGEALPVTWSPCRPIHFVVRPDNAPPDGRRLLDAAIEDVSDATGLAFVDDGATDEAPTPLRKRLQLDRYGDRWAPVLIAWLSAEEAAALKQTVPAVTAPSLFQAPGSKLAFVSGTISLHAPKIASATRTDGDAALRWVLLHELAHLVGLEHVQRPGQVMTRHDRRTLLTRYQDGDLTGLNTLGRGPCQPRL